MKIVFVYSVAKKSSGGTGATEDLPMILLRTCNGSLEHIKAMALNKNAADDFCRASALHAMAYATVAGVATREEVLAFYGSLFTEQEADERLRSMGLTGLPCL